MSRARLFIEWLIMLCLALGIAGWALASGATTRLDMALLDRLTTLAASPPSDRLLVVVIDERSLAAEGRWPWNRAKLAMLVDRLSQAGARGILLDVLLSEPSAPEDDHALANALARSGKVALPYTYAPAEGRSDGLDPVLPLPELRQHLLASGHAVIAADADGVVRRISLRQEGAPKGADSHVIAQFYQQLEGASPRVQADAPIMLIRPTGGYRTVPASAVLRGDVSREFVAGRVVVIGATAAGLGDLFPVPAGAGGTMSGAELQANLYQDIAEDGFITPLGNLPSMLASGGLIVLLFIGFWRLRPFWALVLTGALAMGAVAGAVCLAIWMKIWFTPGPLLLGLLVAYPLWSWRRLAALSDYLLGKADRLALAGGHAPDLDGFDSVSREVGRLDFLVEEVRERRDFLRRVVESTPDALCVFDARGRLLLMNQRAQELFGAETEGLSLRQLLALVGGRIKADAEELRLADGRVFAVSRSVAQYDPAGERMGIAVLTDITERRRAEEDRRHMLEFLSHDMRSPQVAILGLTGLPADDDGEAERFARIRSHARRTLELADNFVQVARLAEVPLSIEEIDAGMLLDEAADRAFAAARDRGAKVAVTQPDDPVFIKGDGTVLSRVFDNLIGNAIRYGREGGRIDLSLRRDGGRAVIEIADDGPGLPEERRDDPFQRFGPRGTKDGDRGGSGLGLAFVAGAIARHLGAISCQTAPGSGTHFTISLPALPPVSDE